MNATGALTALLLASTPVSGADRPHIVIFGGGWGPEGTQLSIEAQVLALADTLKDRRPTLLFADGRPATRAVQGPGPQDEATVLLGLIFNQRRDLHETYRPTTVQANGPASRKGLLETLQRLDGRAGTVVFGVGHGSPAEKGRPAGLDLWGPDDRTTVRDLTRVLDAKRIGPTAFVLGQCHSGAFTALAYVGGRAGQPLAAPSRCVFAAVPADREASGCTNDVSDQAGRAYVSQFTAALQGKGDLDADGRVSLAEAHAYARIHDETVDVPVSSLEVLVDEALGPRAPDPARLDTRTLLADADPTTAAVLKALGPAYVSQRDGALAAERDFRDIQTKAKRLTAAFETLQDRFESTRRVLLDRLLAVWPELANPYHSVSRAMLAGPAPMITRWLRTQPELTELRKTDAQVSASDLELLAVEKQAARLERWLRAAQFVANLNALRANTSLKAQLAAARKCEALVP